MNAIDILQIFAIEIHNEVQAPNGFRWVDLDEGHWLRPCTLDDYSDKYCRILTSSTSDKDLDILITIAGNVILIQVFINYDYISAFNVYHDWNNPELIATLSDDLKNLGSRLEKEIVTDSDWKA